MSGAFNDVATDPNVSLSALNGLMPMVIKGTSGTSIALYGEISRLILGHIPDIGFAGDSRFHGPKWSTFNQIIGSFRVHAVPPAGAGRGPRAGRAAGPGDPEPDRPGPVAGQRAAARPDRARSVRPALRSAAGPRAAAPPPAPAEAAPAAGPTP